MPSIHTLSRRVNVAQAVDQLAEHPKYWDKYKMRTEAYGTPHDVSDIWVRYNAWENFDGDQTAFNDVHTSVWYPCAKVLTEIRPLVAYVYGLVDGQELGGVLITRIRPGKQVSPHIDTGWHAGYYNKYAVQLQGNREQCFHFEDSELRPLSGDIYTFDNSKLHWVTNDSNEDRMTLIICIKERASCRGV